MTTILKPQLNKRSPTAGFFVLTYLVSWTFFAVAGYVLNRVRSSAGAPLSGVLFLVGAVMPSLVALALTARHEGRKGVRDLLAGIGKWRVDARWYLFALTYMVTAKLVAAFLTRLALGEWPPFGQLPWYLMIVAIAFSTPVQAGEEIGWRGYALPRLTYRLGLARSSIALGIIWACWHLPFFFIPGSDNYGQSFPLYLMAVTAISVAMAWVYWRTNGSLLLTMLMHAAINNTAGIVTSAPRPGITNPFYFNASMVAWLVVAVLWIGATYFLVRMRGATLDGRINPTASSGIVIVPNKLNLCITNSL
jgi:membrane protease YdiL (CAAX protease family)